VPENEADCVKIQIFNALHGICIEFWDVPKWPKWPKREYNPKKRERIKNGIGGSGVEKGNKKIPARSAGILCRARLIISKSLC